MTRNPGIAVVCLALGCGPAVTLDDGGQDGDGTGGTSTTTHASISTSSTTGPLPDDTAEAGDSTTEVEPCGAVTPQLVGSVLELGAGEFQMWPADVTGSPDIDLVLANEFGVEVVIGEPGGWGGNGLGLVASPGEVSTELTDLAVGDFLGSGAMDLLLVNGGTVVELWAGDGSGAFAWEHSTSLMGTTSPYGGIQVVDIDGDGRDELVAGLTSNAVALLDVGGGVPSVSLVATDLLGVDTAHVAPWSATDERLHLFVGGYGPDMPNLIWAPLDSIEQGWQGTMAPVVHMGPMVIDDLDGDGEPRWVASEYSPGGTARIWSGAAVDPFLDGRAVMLEEDIIVPHLARVDHPQGLEFATLDGDAAILVDFECMRAVPLGGPPVDGELFAADVDGDGVRDLLGRSDGGVAIFRSAG